MQYLPSTWRLWSKEVYGYVREMTPSREKYVAYKMIEKWLAQGKTPREVSLMWNQGHSGACKSGVNSMGVQYDSCSYAQKVLSYIR